MVPRCLNCQHGFCEYCELVPTGTHRREYGERKQVTDRHSYNFEQSAALSSLGGSGDPVQAYARATEPHATLSQRQPTAQVTHIHNPAHQSARLMTTFNVPSPPWYSEQAALRGLNLDPEPWNPYLVGLNDQIESPATLGEPSHCPSLIQYDQSQSGKSIIPPEPSDTTASLCDIWGDRASPSPSDGLVRNFAALRSCQDEILALPNETALPAWQAESSFNPFNPNSVLDPIPEVYYDHHPNKPQPQPTTLRRRSKASHTVGNGNLSVVHHSPRGRRLLICPYARLDSIRYHKCLALKLDRISYVKQHLRRCHTQPVFCPCCKKIFSDRKESVNETAFRNHRDAVGGCEERMVEEPEGLTTRQIERMKAYPKHKNDEVVQWQAIWDIVFPDLACPKPASPFIDGDRSEETNSLVIFLQNQLPTDLRSQSRDAQLVEQTLAVVFSCIGTWDMRMQTSQQQHPLEVLPQDVDETPDMPSQVTCSMDDVVMNAQSPQVHRSRAFSWGGGTS